MSEMPGIMGHVSVLVVVGGRRVVLHLRAR